MHVLLTLTSTQHAPDFSPQTRWDTVEDRLAHPVSGHDLERIEVVIGPIDIHESVPFLHRDDRDVLGPSELIWLALWVAYLTLGGNKFQKILLPLRSLVDFGPFDDQRLYMVFVLLDYRRSILHLPHGSSVST